MREPPDRAGPMLRAQPMLTSPCLGGLPLNRGERCDDRQAKRAVKARVSWCFGGESGIRTRGGLLTPTRFPGVRLKPLIHLSGAGDFSPSALLSHQATWP